MRVLWFSPVPVLYDEGKAGGWIGSLRRIISQSSDIELAIAFEYNDSVFKVVQENVTYYPIRIPYGQIENVKRKGISNYYWNQLMPKMLDVISDFNPDIIQCFGSEWPYGRISSLVEIPVVIHMQGFKTIYNESSSLAFSNFDMLYCSIPNIRRTVSRLFSKKRIINENKSERALMKQNQYFMGRTEWDKNIVKFFNPSAKYYYCAEAIRPDIYNRSGIWEYSENNLKRLVTITSASVLKGSEIIIRTARILKEEFDYSFVWRVTGDKSSFHLAERKVGISCKDCNIELLGMIDAKEIVYELSNAEAYIHPAIIDNSPNSLCEAQLIGCPVIAANVGGIPQLVDDYRTGLLYPYNEPYTLAFKIMSLCSDRELMLELSSNESQVALQRHNPDRIRNTIISIYRDIIADYK